jgi:hypothetical protein
VPTGPAAQRITGQNRNREDRMNELTTDAVVALSEREALEVDGGTVIPTTMLYPLVDLAISYESLKRIQAIAGGTQLY